MVSFTYQLGEATVPFFNQIVISVLLQRYFVDVIKIYNQLALRKLF